MAYHVEPPFPPNAEWIEAPVFVPTEGFGVLPNYAASPETPPAAPVAPRDLLAALEAELELYEKRGDFAFWNRSAEPAGQRLITRLIEIVAILTPMFATEPGHRHQALKLVAVPTATGLLALRDVRPVIGNALRVVRHLIERRDWYAREARIYAGRHDSTGESARGFSADRPLDPLTATPASRHASSVPTATQEPSRRAYSALAATQEPRR